MIRKVLSFSAWQALAQAISMLTVMGLAFYLDPRIFTSYGVALAVGSIVASNAALRIEQSILVADDADLPYLIPAAFATSIILSLLAFLVAFIAWMAFKADSASMLGIAYGFAFSLVGIGQSLLIRSGDTRQAGVVLIIRSLIMAILLIPAAMLDGGKPALYGAMSVGAGLILALSYSSVRQYPLVANGWRSLFNVLARYRDVWQSYLLQSITSSFSLNLPYLIANSIFDSRIAATYLLSEKIIRAPITLLSYAARSHIVVALATKAQVLSASTLSKITHKLFYGSLIVGVIGVVLAFGVINPFRDISLLISTIILMVPWASSSIAQAPAVAVATAERKTSIIAKVQMYEMGTKAILLGLVAALDYSYYTFVGVAYVVPLIANLLTISLATKILENR